VLRLFIDTWGWLTLRDKRESRHEEVKAFYEVFRRSNGEAFTSDYVLDETITLLFRRLPFSLAKESTDYLQQAIEKGFLRLEPVTRERFDKSLHLRIKLDDKPRISFTDITSMIVMAELGITEILTEDDHFMQVGMGFQKVPQ
jgi:uncharacterized protein